MLKSTKKFDLSRIKSLHVDLQKQGLRLTAPRRFILQTLAENHGPFTAEEIFQRLPKGTCDAATVYRSLMKMAEAGLLRRCDFRDGSIRYELKTSEHAHHHHIICTQCRRVEVLDDCALDTIDKSAKKMGYAHVSHSLEFFGLCPHCQGTKT